MHKVKKHLPYDGAWVALIVLVIACGSVVGQSPPIQTQQAAKTQPDSQEVGTPRIRIRRVMQPIKIDGRLDEAAWSEADVADGFRQQEPNEGTPASEKTEDSCI
jgi:hypothetical protein